MPVIRHKKMCTPTSGVKKKKEAGLQAENKKNRSCVNPRKGIKNEMDEMMEGKKIRKRDR